MLYLNILSITLQIGQPINFIHKKQWVSFRRIFCRYFSNEEIPAQAHVGAGLAPAPARETIFEIKINSEYILVTDQIRSVLFAWAGASPARTGLLFRESFVVILESEKGRMQAPAPTDY